VRTLLVGGVLFLVLVVVAITVPVPYVILTPGPTCNTIGRCYDEQVIAFDGRAESKTSGALYLTTVGITTGRVSVFSALWGWLQGDEVVVPRETIYPPGQSQQQSEQEDREAFTQSQNSAEAAAFCQLRLPKYFGVTSVANILTPADALKIGDQLVSVNGQKVADIDALQKLLATLKPGAKATVAIVRAGTPQSVVVTLQDPAPGATGARIGIQADTTCFAPFTVKLGLNDQIGGPSAGMMFALGIMEKYGDDLTGGRVIAGTGTIDNDGNVGAIGGIQLKMIAARRSAHATLFLAPASNCDDVRGNIPKGLTVAKVSTLAQAVQVLQDVKAGKAVAGC
jgi:PDZ domain-containing protein